MMAVACEGPLESGWFSRGLGASEADQRINQQIIGRWLSCGWGR